MHAACLRPIRSFYFQPAVLLSLPPFTHPPDRTPDLLGAWLRRCVVPLLLPSMVSTLVALQRVVVQSGPSEPHAPVHRRGGWRDRQGRLAASAANCVCGLCTSSSLRACLFVQACMPARCCSDCALRQAAVTGTVGRACAEESTPWQRSSRWHSTATRTHDSRGGARHSAEKRHREAPLLVSTPTIQLAHHSFRVRLQHFTYARGEKEEGGGAAEAHVACVMHRMRLVLLAWLAAPATHVKCCSSLCAAQIQISHHV